MGRQRILVFLILASLAVLAITLMPSTVSATNQTGQVHWVPFHHNGPTFYCLAVGCDRPPETVRATLLDFFGNLALLIPFGALMTAAMQQKTRTFWARVLMVFCAGLLFSLVIETTQYWLPTRSSDVDDVILNSTGAVMGALLFPVLQAGNKLIIVYQRSLGTSSLILRLSSRIYLSQ
jgi:glycopeptide antibiotics resistance protein